MSLLSRFTRPRRHTDPFGPLEWRTLEVLWKRQAPASVRDLQASFPDAAYTTLMTTLDRLYRKGALTRAKQGRAFYYLPALTRAEFEAARAADALRAALASDPTALGPLMSFFVEAVGDRDRELLDDLEALVRSRRADLENKRP
jgi:predicted transcriptional regulator